MYQTLALRQCPTVREMLDHAALFNGGPDKVKANHVRSMNLHKAGRLRRQQSTPS